MSSAFQMVCPAANGVTSPGGSSKHCQVMIENESTDYQQVLLEAARTPTLRLQGRTAIMFGVLPAQICSLQHFQAEDQVSPLLPMVHAGGVLLEGSDQVEEETCQVSSTQSESCTMPRCGCCRLATCQRLCMLCVATSEVARASCFVLASLPQCRLRLSANPGPSSLMS